MAMMDLIIIDDLFIATVINDQGIFRMKGRGEWYPSTNVELDDDGVIHWEILFPKGVLIKYPDKNKTKRFISNDWLNEN